MADQKPSTHYYSNLGGVNQKSSEYTLEKSEFLDLRNVDFNVPNSLQKRPGSTQAVGLGTSGPITSLFEYIRLEGPSFIVAGSNTAMFLLQANAFTLLSSGWNNGQPTDMLTFVNKLWMANGQKYQYWGGTGTAQPVGLPCASKSASFPSGAGPLFMNQDSFLGETFFVAGATVNARFASATVRGVYVAYSYVRSDGYFGPVDFISNANQVVLGSVASGTEYFSFLRTLHGFTIPTGFSISSIALWVSVDTVTATSPRDLQGNFIGTMGYIPSDGGALRSESITLLPNAPTNRFHLFTTISGSSLFPVDFNGLGLTYWSATFFLGASAFTQFDSIATGAAAFSGVPFCWFNSNIPKYIDVNQNVMFMSGFSNRPSSLDFSEIGQPENIQPENTFEVRTNDGDRIMGHKAYNNQVVVLKENSFHKVVGDSPENYELVELSLEYGCLSNKTVVEFREKLAWLDTQGIVVFDGASWDLASYAVEDIFRRMNLTAAKEKAVGINHLYRNQLWFGIPIDGSTENNVTVVYDYLVNAWTFFDGFNPSSFAMIRGALPIATAWRGDYSGMVYYHGESFYGDNGRGISCGVFSSFDKWDGENSTSIWRRFFLDVQPAPGLTGNVNGEINVSVFSDYNKVDAQATFSIFQSAFQSRAEIGVVGKAMAMRLNHHSASLPLLINGYTWTKRFLRNV